MDAILGPLAAGIVLGLSAGLAPGPLLALVISQTLRHGPGAGARVAMAPLITDVPIVAACVWLVASVSGGVGSSGSSATAVSSAASVSSGSAAGSSVVLAAISLAGAAFVAYLAWDTWRAEPPAAPEAGAVAVAGADVRGEAGVGAASAAGSWRRGALVNALSPHPWLTWIAVGAPTVIAAWRAGGPAAAGAFIAGFYVCLVGAKLGVAVLVGRARGRVAGRGYRIVMRALAVLLVAFAVGLALQGWRLATGGAG